MCFHISITIPQVERTHVLSTLNVQNICFRENNIFSDIDLFETVGKQRLVPIDHPLIAAARAIGTSFGDGVGSIEAKPISSGGY